MIQALEKFSRLLLLIAGMACVAMLALINLDVFLKYAANQPIPGTLECVAYYFMPLIVFCAFAHVQQHRQNIEISLLTDQLPRKPALFLETAAKLLSLVYLAIFIWAGLLAAAHTTEIGETTGIVHFELPVWPPRWLVPVVMAATFFWMLHQMIRALRTTDGDGQ